jgi:hypothetical protein
MHEIRVDPSALWETGGVLGSRVDAAADAYLATDQATLPDSPGGATPATSPSKPPTWPRQCCGSTG